MGRSVSSQRLAHEWISFLLVSGEETRGFFSWSVHACWRLQCPVVAWHCSWCLGVVAASPVSHPVCLIFLACCPVSLGWSAGEFLSFFTVCCTDIGLSGSKERSLHSSGRNCLKKHNEQFTSSTSFSTFRSVLRHCGNHESDDCASGRS